MNAAERRKENNVTRQIHNWEKKNNNNNNLCRRRRRCGYVHNGMLGIFSAESEKNWIDRNVCRDERTSARTSTPYSSSLYTLNEFRVNLCNNYVHDIYIIWLEFYACAAAVAVQRTATSCALSLHV